MRRLVLLLAFAFVLTGCGEKHDFTTLAETEGIYVDVGNLVYQVQLSRFLTPGDLEDKEYLAGLPEGTEPLADDEIWFGVWMRVKNYSGETQTPTDTFMIVDTEETEFSPVPLSGPFAYRPYPILHAGVLPIPDSAAANGPVQGALILFRLKNDNLQNRPLELHIEQDGFDTATVDLDL